MSNDIRLYEPEPGWFDEADPMTVTAVMGDPRLDLRIEDPEERKGHGRSVQLTIGRGPVRGFTVLTEAQTLDLIGILSKRLACADGFAATDPLEEYIVQPDGTKEVREDSW